MGFKQFLAEAGQKLWIIEAPDFGSEYFYCVAYKDEAGFRAALKTLIENSENNIPEGMADFPIDKLAKESHVLSNRGGDGSLTFYHKDVDLSTNDAKIAYMHATLLEYGAMDEDDLDGWTGRIAVDKPIQAKHAQDILDAVDM